MEPLYVRIGGTVLIFAVFATIGLVVTTIANAPTKIQAQFAFAAATLTGASLVGFLFVALLKLWGVPL